MAFVSEFILALDSDDGIDMYDTLFTSEPGRSQVPFEEMCLLDIYYIENWSLSLDFQILLRTVPHVLLAHGAS